MLSLKDNRYEGLSHQEELDSKVIALLKECNISKDHVEHNPQTGQLYVSFQPHEKSTLANQDIHFNQVTNQLSTQYDIEVTWKLIDKKRDRHYRINFQGAGIEKLAEQDKAQALREVEEAKERLLKAQEEAKRTVEEKSFGVRLHEVTRSLETASISPPSVSTPPSSVDEQIRSGLSKLIEEQTVNYQKQDPSQHSNYSGKFRVNIGENRVLISFNPSIINNWPCLRNLQKMICETLKCKINSGDRRFKETSRGKVGQLYFPKKACVAAFTPDHDAKPAVLTSYQRHQANQRRMNKQRRTPRTSGGSNSPNWRSKKK